MLLIPRYPSVGFVTRRAIACGFLVMQMFYNPSKASIVGIFPSSFLLPSAVCLLPSPSQDHQKLPRTIMWFQKWLVCSFNDLCLQFATARCAKEGICTRSSSQVARGATTAQICPPKHYIGQHRPGLISKFTVK
ncbi:hypothetical protein NIES4072_74310 [Nostoc commune NIES-4072]|uniref:Uncharacterized protein n=1 Tax=Nostoc commune NIES-4072 TaxID=2005467 RepID=A0A2R5G0A0_NOSCO|nr:hypothetical protein NIES4070_74300 [Nostoc commune HK-02]GBG23719.1 hypothetical protein NIES4072_74310 [Nostoc commune NIES-4072]